MGINTIAVAVGEDPETIEDVYEPFLIQTGFLNRTPRGRTVTGYCYEYFGIPENRSQAVKKSEESKDPQYKLL